jgi:hypothetical protein
MSKAGKLKTLYKDQSVSGKTLKLILVVGAILFLTSLFAGTNAIHKAVWPALSSFWANPRGYESEFTAAEWVALITPLLALLMAWFAHDQDESHKGRGIKDILRREVGSEPYSLQTDVIAASMTKQSVLAAVAAVSVTLIQLFDRKDVFGKLVKFLSTVGFAFTILFLLISMVCYDYASRFHWPNFYKVKLVQKALLLDVYSWYFLLTSFLLSIALINPRLSVLTCVAAGVLMWWYYFFRCEDAGFKIKDSVLIKSGEHEGDTGRIASFISTDPKPTYLVRVKDESIKVVASELEKVTPKVRASRHSARKSRR